MRRKILSAVLTISFLVAVNLAQAQQPKKVPRIGYLSPRDLKAAKQIGLTIPNRVLERANKVIK